MKQIIVAIGGTGERVTEAFIHLAAAGAVSAGDYEICCVDMDIECPDYKNCRDMLKLYGETKEALAGSGSGFMAANITRPNIEGNEWTWELSTEVKKLLATGRRFETSTVDDLAQNDPLSSLLLEFFHSGVERGTIREGEEFRGLSGGFYGRPSVGAALIKAIFETNPMGNNPLGQYLNTYKTQDIAVTLVASSFGATGASIFPNLAEKLRAYHNSLPNAQKGKLYINGVLMLPYCTYPQPDGGEGAIKPGSFYESTATILRYYATKANFIRDGNAQTGFTLNSLQLVGTDNPLELNADEYCTHGKKQAHRFLEKDLLGAIAIRDTFLTAADAGSGNNVYGFAANTAYQAEALQMGTLAETWLALQTYLYPWMKYIDTEDGKESGFFNANKGKLSAAVECAKNIKDVLAVFRSRYSGDEMKNSTKDKGILKDIREIVSSLESAKPYFDRYLDFLLNLQTRLQPNGETKVNNAVTVLKTVNDEVQMQQKYDELKTLLPKAASNEAKLREEFNYYVYGVSSATYGNYSDAWRKQKPIPCDTEPTGVDFLKAYAGTAHQVAAHG